MLDGLPAVHAAQFARILGVAIAVAAGGCSRSDAPPKAVEPTRTAPRSSLTAGELRSYTEGRRREIELTGAALALLSCTSNPDQRTVLIAGAAPDHAEGDAAVRAGLGVADYRRLVAHVDSILRAVSDQPDSQTRRLDSLRVELAVLRARIGAEQSQLSQPGSSKCDVHQ